jgi:hypothetical protein
MVWTEDMVSRYPAPKNDRDWLTRLTSRYLVCVMPLNHTSGTAGEQFLQKWVTMPLLPLAKSHMTT